MTYDASNIQVLEGLEAVRQRPSMYIGDTHEAGLHHLVWEVIDNSMDEVLAGFCTKININLNKDGSITIEDNGRGIPIGIHKETGISALEVVLTKLHSGGKFDDKIYNNSSGLHGVGISVVSALSSKLSVSVYTGTKWAYQTYEKGIPSSKMVVKNNKEKRTGTSITFLPDKTIFSTVDFKLDIIKRKCMELLFLNKEVSIWLNSKKLENSYIEYLKGTSEEITPLIEISKDGVYIALQYTSAYKEEVYSYVNNVNTKEGGSHLLGLKKGLLGVFQELIKSKIPLTWDDVKEGLLSIISIRMYSPQFEGQTKTKLGNREITPLVENLVIEQLTSFFEENKPVLQKIKDKILLSVKAREASRKAREHVRLKAKVNDLSLAGKLADCQIKDPRQRELFLVEGQSAGGSAKMGRDRRFQAILPLKGKILNVEKAKFSTMMKNEEIQQIIAAIGTGVGKDFNIRKLNYYKIIMMFDSDVDGAHITTLFLTLIYRQLPELITHGHIYKACPPLFGVKKGSTIIRYILDEEELEKVRKDLPRGSFIQRYKGLGEMSADQLSDTALDPETRVLKRITLEDVEETDKIFDTLMGDNVQVRKEFIEEYLKEIDAKEAFKHLQI